MAFVEQLPTTQSSDPMLLSKDRVKEIIQQAPKGTNPAGIVAGLREKGYTLEGFDQAQATSTPSVAQPQPGFFSKVASGIGNFLSTAFTGLPTQALGEPGKQVEEFGKGLAKSVGSTAVGAAQLGQKIVGATGIQTGEPIQQPEIFKPKGTAQEIGKTVGDIAQFFIPGGAEEKVATKLEDLVNIGKFAEVHGPAAAKALQGILHGITQGISTAGVTATQTGGDVAKTETAGILGFVGGSLPKLAEIVGKPVANFLQESALKLGPAKQAELGSSLKPTVDWMTKELRPGTPTSQYYQATSKINSYEKTLQDFLSTDAKGVTVNKNQLINKLDSLKGEFTTERDSDAIDNQIDGLIKTLKNPNKWEEKIPVGKLNELKRSTYTNAWNKAGTKVLDWVEAYVGNVLKTSIEDATKGMKIDGKAISDFNKDYGSAIQAKNLLKIAKGKKIGISGKALLMLLGSPAGLAGEAAGLVLGGTKLSGMGGAIKTGIGAGIESAGSTEALPTIAKTATGIIDQSSPPQESQ